MSSRDRGWDHMSEEKMNTEGRLQDEHRARRPMTSPFIDASLSDLKSMLPDLSDPELDALCACVCEGEWVRSYSSNAGSFWLQYHKYGHSLSRSVPCYTSDWREAGRLVEKYEIELGRWDGKWSIHDTVPCVTTGDGPLAEHANPCRAITEAAVTTALAEAMEGGGE